MRGGAIPLLAWATGLVVLLAINWIWTGDAVQVGSFAFAVMVIYAGGGLLVLMGRHALRRGAPAPRRDPEAVTEASLASVIAGLSIGCILFGVVWANFLVFFGAGVLLLSLARIAIEVRAERDSRRRYLPGPER
jgi:hypothetical protein